MSVHDPEAARRSAALQALDLIGSAVGPEFDALAAVAARIVGTPIAAFTVIDDKTQHMVATYGIAPTSMPREESFCDQTIRQSGVLVVPDARLDLRFADIPIVAGDPHLRFYAGVPIEARDRTVVGALCVVDPKPRDLTAEQQASLVELAKVAEALIAARGAARQAIDLAAEANDQSEALTRQERIFRQAERLAMIGGWRYEPLAETIIWSEGVRRIHEVDADYVPTLANALDFYPPAARAIVSEALARTMDTGAPFDFETDFLTARGRLLRVRSRGEVERRDGVIVALDGVFQDVTTRWQMEEQLRRSAHVDALTGIANRAGFDERIAQAIARATTNGTPLALALIDLDAFKSVNDTHGHMIGDDVLRAYGLRLRAEWLSDLFPARLGGDEFALIAEGPATRDLSARIDRLLGDLARPIATDTFAVEVPGTIGWTRFGAGMENARDLIHAADTALYEAKRNRRGTARAACA